MTCIIFICCSGVGSEQDSQSEHLRLSPGSDKYWQFNPGNFWVILTRPLYLHR